MEEPQEKGKASVREVTSLMLWIGRIFKYVLVAVVCVLVFGLGLWCVYEYDIRTDWLTGKLDLPDVTSLRKDDLYEQTDISTDDGRRVACFSSPEHRIKVSSPEEIPRLFELAIIAQEDQRFYAHKGVDYRAIFRAMGTNTLSIFARRHKLGASTLTMQVAKNMLLKDSRQSYKRKLKEAILALKIERQFTKREILLLYVNMPYLGRGQHGIEAGSRSYFGKPAKDLALEEVAFIVSLISKPGLLDRESGADKASLERREALRYELTKRTRHVIDRMGEMGFLKSWEEYNRAQDRAGRLSFLPAISGCSLEVMGPYFIEELRRRHKDKLALNTGGLQIFTPFDPELQHVAEGALREGLDVYRARHTYPDEKLAKLAEVAGVSVPDFTKEQAADRESIRGLAFGVDFAGRMRFMIGGEDYKKSKWNVATQGFRQPGSTFKAFTYAALDETNLKELIAEGVSNENLLLELDKHCLVVDAPIAVSRGRGRAPKWISNSQSLYRGKISCRLAIAESRNTAAIRAGEYAGTKHLVELANRLGLGRGERKYELQPYPTTAIGASDIIPIDLSAYLAFVNGGYKVPLVWEYDICKKDNGGMLRSVFYTDPADPVDPSVTVTRPCTTNGALPTSYPRVLHPVIADHMRAMLQAPVDEATGTAHALRVGIVVGQGSIGLGSKVERISFPFEEAGELAAKTGTATNDNGDVSDAWFIVLIPGKAGKPETGMLMVFWMGKTNKSSSLGPGETGGRNLLPVAAKIMKFLKDKRGLLQRGNKFEPIVPLDVASTQTLPVIGGTDSPKEEEVIDPTNPATDPQKLLTLPPEPPVKSETGGETAD